MRCERIFLFANLSIAARMRLDFGSLLLCTPTLSGLSLVEARRMDAAKQDIIKVALPAQSATADLLAQSALEGDALRQSADTGHESYYTAFTDWRDKSAKDLQNLAAQAGLSSSLRQRLDQEITPTRAAIETGFAARVQEVRSGKRGQAAARLEAGASERAAFRQLLQSVFADAALAAGEDNEHGRTAFGQFQFLVIILFLFAAALGGVLSQIIARSITRPLTTIAERMQFLQMTCLYHLGEVVDALAQGDLTTQVQCITRPLDIDRHDEIGIIANMFDAMLGQVHSTLGSFADAQTNLRGLVSEVAQSAQAVLATSDQLSAVSSQVSRTSDEIGRTMQDVAQAADHSAQASQEMAQGSELQAHSAMDAAQSMLRLQSAIAQVQEAGERQQTAVSCADAGMRQTAQAVEQVTASAQQMAVTAQQAANVASEGGKAVAQTTASMDRIREQVESSSEKVRSLDKMGQEIGAIVETIDHIAEQTNLLALNPAIEAARAGEHGRGFAVVADEARKLAERCGAATREISALVSSVRSGVDQAVGSMTASDQEVQAGAARGGEARSALKEILQAAASVGYEVAQVTGATQEMAASILAVRDEVTTVLRMAQENEGSVRAMAHHADQVTQAMTTVASISEEAAAGAQEMSASAEEVSAGAQNVSAAGEEQTRAIRQAGVSAENLNSMASRLEELVKRFRLEEPLELSLSSAGTHETAVTEPTRKAA